MLSPILTPILQFSKHRDARPICGTRSDLSHVFDSLESHYVCLMFRLCHGFTFLFAINFELQLDNFELFRRMVQVRTFNIDRIRSGFRRDD